MTRVDFLQLCDNLFLLLNICHREDLPQLRNAIQEHATKVEVQATGGGRIFPKLDHEVLTVDGHITSRVQNLSHDRQDHKLDVRLVRMVLEHVNGCHEGALHRRGEDHLPIDAVDDTLARLRLHDSNWVQFRIDALGVRLHCLELCRVFAVLTADDECLVVEARKTVPNQYIRALFK